MLHTVKGGKHATVTKTLLGQLCEKSIGARVPLHREELSVCNCHQKSRQADMQYKRSINVHAH